MELGSPRLQEPRSARRDATVTRCGAAWLGCDLPKVWSRNSTHPRLRLLSDLGAADEEYRLTSREDFIFGEQEPRVLGRSSVPLRFARLGSLSINVLVESAHYRLSSGADSELRIDMPEMEFHCRFDDEECSSDLAVGRPLDQQGKDVPLSFSEGRPR